MDQIRISVEVDLQANAAYVLLTDQPVVKTVELNDEVIVDLDSNDMVVGIETLRIDAPIPFKDLATRFHVHSDVIALLELIRPNPSAFVKFHFAADTDDPAAPIRQPVITAR
jgi:uncharacterized protein YuzE